jgi:hypothetical protein
MAVASGLSAANVHAPRPDARDRINTVFMTGMLLGGAGHLLRRASPCCRR